MTVSLKVQSSRILITSSLPKSVTRIYNLDCTLTSCCFSGCLFFLPSLPRFWMDTPPVLLKVLTCSCPVLSGQPQALPKILPQFCIFYSDLCLQDFFCYLKVSRPKNKILHLASLSTILCFFLRNVTFTPVIKISHSTIVTDCQFFPRKPLLSFLLYLYCPYRSWSSDSPGHS